MKQTEILYPLDTDIPQSEIKRHRDAWKSIQKHLNDMREAEDISFDQLPFKLNLTEENYLMPISSTLNAPTVFFKRHPNEPRIDN